MGTRGRRLQVLGRRFFPRSSAIANREDRRLSGEAPFCSLGRRVNSCAAISTLSGGQGLCMSRLHSLGDRKAANVIWVVSPITLEIEQRMLRRMSRTRDAWSEGFVTRLVWCILYL